MPSGSSQSHYASPTEPSTTEEPRVDTLRGRILLAREGLFSWKSLGGLFAALLVVGWIFIVVVLIQEEKWQLVLVSWLLLYAAAHFCYWYFRRHNLLPFNSNFCMRRRDRTSVRPISKPTDLPPSYEEVIKSEPPPPAYCSVAIDGSKCSSAKSHKFSIFSFDSISTVLGKSTPLGYQTKPSRPTSADSISSVMARPDYGNRNWSPPPFSISQQLSNSSQLEERDGLQEMSLDSRNYRNQPSRQMSSRSARSSLIRRESIVVNDPIAPIMGPIYDNSNSFSESPGVVPIHCVQECHSLQQSTSGESNVNMQP